MKNIRLTSIFLTAIIVLAMLPCYAQVCSELITDSVINQIVPPTVVNYGNLWGSSLNYRYRSRYVNYDGTGNPGSVNVGDHVAAGLTGANGATNFSGNVYYQNNAVTEFTTRSNAGFRTINFDVNYILESSKVNPFNFNDFGLDSLPHYLDVNLTILNNGFHIEILGDIRTFEVLGQNAAIDNLCLDSIVVLPLPPAGCTDFQDTHNLFNRTSSSYPNFDNIWYNGSYATFRSAFFDYENVGANSGWGAIKPNQSYRLSEGFNPISSTEGNLLTQWYSITEVNVSAFPVLDKVVEFDVSFIEDDQANNPFYVNGQGLTTLPSGVTYTATPLAAGHHITLSGPINTFELHGQDLAIDNLCISDPSSPPPSTPQPPPSNGSSIVLSPHMNTGNTAIAVPSGAQIFNSNGQLVLTTTTAINWTGTNQSNQQLPMGQYTISDGNGNLTFVTLIL